MKYLVMECHLSYAVVLDENGRFRKVTNRHYEVGQTVTDIIEMKSPQVAEMPVKKKKYRWVSSLCAMAACLVLVFTYIFTSSQQAYASVYMSINPEVRIDVNRRDTVVGLEGMNGDGRDLIEDYTYQKKDLDLVMDELVDRAIAMGYLHEGGSITLTLDAEDNRWVVQHEGVLRSHLTEYLTEKITVSVEVAQPSAPENVPLPEKVVIDTSGDSGYGSSDYGTSDTADDSGSLSGDSGYEAPTDSDDAQTDYGTTSEGDSSYEDPPADSNSFDSTVLNPPSDDGQSEYTAPNDGQSGYASSGDDGQSGYETDDD